MRKSYEELEQLMKDYGVNRLWSWSKVHTFENDPYTYFLKYVDENKPKPDKPANGYAYFGGIAHDLLEKYYSREVKSNQEMVELFESKTVLSELDVIKFSANEQQNATISNNYLTCVTHFLNEYEKNEGAKLEQFVHGMVGGNLFQGYIDKMYVEDGILHIVDYKTSTEYKGKKINQEKGQLSLYAYLVHQMFPNIPYEKMTIDWNFLKYVHIECEQVNGDIKTTSASRNGIADTLKAKLKIWLKREGCTSEEMEDYIEAVRYANVIEHKDKNCLDCLPENVRNKFKITDCLVSIRLDEAQIDEIVKRLENNCRTIIAKEELYKTTKDEHLFWSDITSADMFYYINLCDYSDRFHKPLKEYNEELSKMNSTDTLTQSEAIEQFLFSE